MKIPVMQKGIVLIFIWMLHLNFAAAQQKITVLKNILMHLILLSWAIGADLAKTIKFP